MSIIEKALRAKKAGTVVAPRTPAPRANDRGALARGEDFIDDLPGDPEQAVNGTPAAELGSDGGLQADVLPATPNYREIRHDRYHDEGSNRTVLEIPFDKLQERGFLSPSTPRSRMAEEFRTIKRPILRNIDERGPNRVARPNLVMVTSALQGDGKTFSSINLAISIAMEQDKTVLFVDADVVRATAGKTLGVEPGTAGLIDLLYEGSDVEPSDVILHTNMDKLRVLPAGNASDQSTELLASQTMHDFMLELSNRYPDRVIVFDSPPLLLTTEATVLASFMGQIVFVASADVTPMNAVTEALEHIGEDKMVGVILNRASQRRSKLLGIGSYGYGYGYDRGYGYGADRSAQSSAESDSKSP